MPKGLTKGKKMNTYTQTTEAIREYQKLQHLVNRRIEETDNTDIKKFWVRLHAEKAAEIAQAHSLTIFDLVDQWETWAEAVEKEREAIRKADN